MRQPVRFGPVPGQQEGAGSHLPESAIFLRGMGRSWIQTLCQLPAVGEKFLVSRNGFARTIPSGEADPTDPPGSGSAGRESKRSEDNERPGINVILPRRP